MTRAGKATIPRWLLDDETVTAYAKLVYVVLDSHKNEFGTSFPSHRAIAAKAGISITSVKKAMQELRDIGVLTWLNRTRENASKTSNEYRLLDVRPVDTAVDRSATSPHP